MSAVIRASIVTAAGPVDVSTVRGVIENDCSCGGAASTATGASGAATPPSAPIPVTKTWCWPPSTSEGIVTLVLKVPSEPTTTEPTDVGVECSSSCTVLPGAKPLPETGSDVPGPTTALGTL